MALTRHYNGSATFERTPNELKLMVGDELDIADLNALARTSSGNNCLLSAYMYRRAKDIRTEAFFFQAVRSGNLAAVQRFIEVGISVNARGWIDRTALHTCARMGLVPLAQLLIGHGAEHSAVDQNGDTPLHSAIISEQDEMVRCLIEAGVHISPTPGRQPPLITAARRGAVPSLQILLEHGADATTTGTDGETLLHYVQSNGMPTAVIPLLLRSGAQLEARDIWGRTPLHHAASYGRAENVEALLLAGADPMATDGDGNTPLHFAVGYRGSLATANLILGLASQLTDTLSRALHDAAGAVSHANFAQIEVYINPAVQYVDPSDGIIHLLLDAQADIAATNHLSSSALRWAVFRSAYPECWDDA